MKELDERAARMRELLDKHVAAMGAGEPAAARNIAYDMLQVLTGLYTAAYVAADQKARREGKTL